MNNQAEIPEQQSAPQPTPEQTPERKHISLIPHFEPKTILFGLAVFILIIIALVAYLVLIRNYNDAPQSPPPIVLPTALPPSPTIIITPESTPSAETTNWKTYRNEEFGFGFKYPPTWLLEEITEDGLRISHSSEPSFLTDSNFIKWYRNYQQVEKVTGFRYDSQSKKWGYLFYSDYYNQSGPGDFKELEKLFATETGAPIYCLSGEGSANHLISLPNNVLMQINSERCIRDSSYPSPEDKLYRVMRSFNIIIKAEIE